MTDAYRSNHDRIFGKKPEKTKKQCPACAGIMDSMGPSGAEGFETIEWFACPYCKCEFFDQPGLDLVPDNQFTLAEFEADAYDYWKMGGGLEAIFKRFDRRTSGAAYIMHNGRTLTIDRLREHLIKEGLYKDHTACRNGRRVHPNGADHGVCMECEGTGCD